MKTFLRLLLLRAALLVTLVMFCASANSWAQTENASLSGIVADATGARIPGATIVLRNSRTHAERHTTSSGTGTFEFISVPSGTYNVTITMKGFEALVTRDVELHPNDKANLAELHMKIGAETDTVTVEANTDIASSAEISSLITAKDIQKQSTVGRDVSELLRTQAGFSVLQAGLDNSAGSSAEVAGTYSGLSNYVGNGATANGASLISDGANVTDPVSGNGQTQTVNMDFVQEVKIETSNFGADTAKGPTVITAVGKSGTQSFHGNLRLYARTYQMNAQDWFQKFNGFSQIQDRYIYPGVEIGGPVLIPHTNFNHDRKLTFEAGAEDYIQRNVYAYGSLPKSLLQGLVPTKAMLNGDFTLQSLANYLGVTPQDITGEAGGHYGAGCTAAGQLSTYLHICASPASGGTGSSQFYGGKLTGGVNGIDPGVSAILRAYYEPNCTDTTLASCPGPGPTINFYNTQTLNLENPDSYQLRFRLDYNLNDTNKLYVVYNGQFSFVSKIPEQIFYSPGTSGSAVLGGVDTPGKINASTSSDVGSLNYTHVFNARMTNEAFAGLSYARTSYVSGDQELLSKSYWGYPYKGIYPNASKQLPSVATYSTTGASILPFALVPDFSNGPFLSTKFLPSAGDNFSWTVRKHNLKFGVYLEHDTANQTDISANTNGQISTYYLNGVTVPDTSGVFNTKQGVWAASENYLADFFTGSLGSLSQQNFNDQTNLYYWTVSWFATDSFKVTSRLTLDYGVRFDHLGPWQDKHGLGLATFFPSLYVNDPKTTPTQTIANPDGTPFLPGIRWHGGNSATNHNAGYNGVPNSGVPGRFAFVSPRVGLVFDAYGNGRTIIRGGWGMYRAHDSWNDFTGPTSVAEGLLTTSAGGQTGSTTLAAIDAMGPTLRCDSNSQTACPSVLALDPTDNQQPLTYTYSFSVSQRMPSDSVFNISYVGNQSTDLLTDNASQNAVQSQDLRDINAVPIGSFFRPDPNPASTYFGQIPNPSSISQFQINDFRPYPAYTHIGLPRHIAYANYNALQTSWNKQKGRMSYGLNYTFSKALGIRGAYLNGTAGDPTNLRANYGPLAFDRTSIVAASYSYDEGEQVHFNNKFLRGLSNYWLISGITNLQSGPNLQAVYYPNLMLSGFATSSYSNNACSLSTGVGTSMACAINSNTVLGTPDVMLQPTLRAADGCGSGNPTGNLQKHQYVNGNCFGLGPQGINGPTNLGYIRGPAFFNSDLTVQKTLPIKDQRNVQLRIAAFNFLNHPLVSFSSRYPAEANLRLYDPNSLGFAGATLLNSTNPNGNCSSAGSNCFGYAGYKTGRRVLEVSARYSF
jgi:Carboxypeptidase regulatory-like domain/TonB-dependent Receptor Plug Domain